MKKNILIISLVHPNKGSGLEKVAKEQGIGLKDASHNVIHIFIGDKDFEKEENGMNYISIKCSKIPGLSFLEFSFKLIKYLKKLGENDVVIDNIGGCFMFFLFGNKKIFKLISVVHGSIKGVLKSLHLWKNNIFNKILTYFYFKICDLESCIVIKKSDIVVALSDSLKQEIIDLYKIDEKKVVIINNGFDSIQGKIFVNHKDNEHVNVIFVGNDNARKGADILYDVAKKLENKKIQFYLIGGKTDKLQSKDNVIPLGSMDRNGLYKKMSDSDIIFLPSHYEGQPLVLLEAMSLGCIPVFSGACHMDMLENTKLKNYISKNNLIDDYINIFNNILRSIDLIDDMRKYAQACVKDFSWSNQIKLYVDLINNL